MNKTIKDWFAGEPEPRRTKLLHYLETIPVNNFGADAMANSIWDAIDKGFMWTNTIEKGNYWDNIYTTRTWPLELQPIEKPTEWIPEVGEWAYVMQSGAYDDRLNKAIKVVFKIAQVRESTNVGKRVYLREEYGSATGINKDYCRKATSLEIPIEESINLPVFENESWCVKVTEDNIDVVKKFMGIARTYTFTIGAYYGIKKDDSRDALSKTCDYKQKFNNLLTTAEFYAEINHITTPNIPNVQHVTRVESPTDTFKFNVGDKVKVVEGGWGCQSMYIGKKVVIVKKLKYLERCHYIVEPQIGNFLYGESIDEKAFELYTEPIVNTDNDNWCIQNTTLTKDFIELFLSYVASINNDNYKGSQLNGYYGIQNNKTHCSSYSFGKTITLEELIVKIDVFKKIYALKDIMEIKRPYIINTVSLYDGIPNASLKKPKNNTDIDNVQSVSLNLRTKKTKLFKY